MDCREFKDKHVAYVDDVLSAAEMAEMQRHLRACCRCARHDTCVRRGLMVARSLPQIEPSPDFMERLNARLRELDRLESGSATVARGPSTRTFSLVAASVLAVAGLAAAFAASGRPTEPLRLAPVVASLPAEPPAAVASPAVVASLATGIPIWPAVFMMSQTPAVHMVNVELREGQ